MSLYELFSILKAYEFIMDRRIKEEEVSTD